MTAKRSFIDTNVLVYANSPSSPQHHPSLELLESGNKICASAQIFAEFYSVITNPRRVTEPLSSADACRFIREVIPVFQILPITRSVVPRWIAFAEQHGVTGHNVFDLQIVATMIDNDVQTIFTYNTADFEPYSTSIEILTPGA